MRESRCETDAGPWLPGDNTQLPCGRSLIPRGRLAVFAAVLTIGAFSMLAASPVQAGLINDEDDVAWVSLRDLKSDRFSAAFKRYKPQYRLIDVGVHRHGIGLRYSMVWRQNTDGRGWAARRGMTSSGYHKWWKQYRAQGLRPRDVEAYRTLKGQRWAGIWEENREGLSWSSRRGMTSSQYVNYFQKQRAAGRRPVDIEIYPTRKGLRIAAIFYENKQGIGWASLRGMRRQRYQKEVTERAANGFRVIDFESYRTSKGQRYAAIWEQAPPGRAWVVRSDRRARAFANLWRRHRDQGYRLVDFERYSTSSGRRYAGVWVQNDSRFRYARKGEIDALITQYRSDNNLPGISVAVIWDGQMLYRRGFGRADVEGGKVAHGETVYSAASVSKVIGGTLAAKLEDEQQLRDGTAVDLDLTRRIDTYLTDAPTQHTQQVDHLLAHLGCIPHYNTTPGIANQTRHYRSALKAVRSIWGNPLVTGCVIGQTRSYSTHGFTFAAAALERATGRRIQSLLRSELAKPYGLGSMRAQWGSRRLPSNYERAVPYNNAGNPGNYQNNSWKVLGGGIEVSAVDLARFGEKVRDGEIVAPGQRDTRMWSPVRAGCGASISGACQNGLAWSLSTDTGGRVVQHGGRWTGARAFLRVYRDVPLVVAIMSNRGNHTVDDVGGLTRNIADVVLPTPG